MTRLLIVCLTLLWIHGIAAAQSALDATVVTVSGRSVYISAGRDAGVIAGARVVFRLKTGEVVTATIVDVSATNARAELPEEAPMPEPQDKAAVEIVDVKLTQHFTRTCFVIPGLVAVHGVVCAREFFFIARFNSLFVIGNGLCFRAIGRENILENRSIVIESVLLRQKTKAHLFVVRHQSTVGRIQSGQDAKERALSCPIARYERYFLSLLNTERQVFEQHVNAIRLGYIFDGEVIHRENKWGANIGVWEG